MSEPTDNLPASRDPNEIEIVARDDIMFLRIAKIGRAMMDFYDFVADQPPQEVEEFFEKYPRTAEAKMRIAPVAFARLIPVKIRQERAGEQRPARRLTQDEIRQIGLSKSKQELTRLVEGETK